VAQRAVDEQTSLDVAGREGYIVVGPVAHMFIASDIDNSETREARDSDDTFDCVVGDVIRNT